MHSTLLSADMASWWSLCPDIEIKVAKFLDLILGGNSKPMCIPGVILQGPMSSPEWSSSLGVRYFKVSVSAVIGLKQSRDQDSLNTHYQLKLYSYNVD